MEPAYNFSYSANMSPTSIGIAIVVFLFYLYCGWKIFQKAGKPGWAVIIPIYNIYVLLQIVGKPGWWLILYLIPIVNIIIGIIVVHNLSLRFGRGVGTTLGLLFLNGIFIPILAFGSAEYTPALSS